MTETVPVSSTCAHCGQTKPVAEFSPLSSRPTGCHPWCKRCRSERNARVQREKYIPTGNPIGRPRKVR